MKKTKFYLLRESVVQSIAADIFSFSIMFALLFVNYYLLGNKWYLDIFAIATLFIFMYGRIISRSSAFNTKSELIAHLEGDSKEASHEG